VSAGLRLADAFPEAVTLGERLVAQGLTLAVAESCTGGLLGAAITAVPGSSRYFRGGIIAYDDTVKRALLGVKEATLQAFGAVSREVAAAMAQGVAHRLLADIGLAITGVAGPGAEGTSKPVGLIFVAAHSAAGDEGVGLGEDGDRESNRFAAVRAALTLGEREVLRWSARGAPPSPGA
jgi:PncC family amidohydrolase